MSKLKKQLVEVMVTLEEEHAKENEIEEFNREACYMYYNFESIEYLVDMVKGCLDSIDLSEYDE